MMKFLKRLFSRVHPRLRVKIKVAGVRLIPRKGLSTKDFIIKVVLSGYQIKRVNNDGSIDTFVKKNFIKNVYSNIILIRNGIKPWQIESYNKD